MKLYIYDQFAAKKNIFN